MWQVVYPWNNSSVTIDLATYSPRLVMCSNPDNFYFHSLYMFSESAVRNQAIFIQLRQMLVDPKHAPCAAHFQIFYLNWNCMNVERLLVLVQIWLPALFEFAFALNHYLSLSHSQLIMLHNLGSCSTHSLQIEIGNKFNFHCLMVLLNIETRNAHGPDRPSSRIALKKSKSTLPKGVKKYWI